MARPTVTMFIDKFDREVTIEADSPLVAAQKAAKKPAKKKAAKKSAE